MFPYVQKVYDPLLSSTAGIEYLSHEDPHLSAALTPDSSPTDMRNQFVLNDSSEFFVFHSENDPIEELFPELLEFHGLNTGLEVLPNAGDVTDGQPHTISKVPNKVDMEVELYTPEPVVEVEVETEYDLPLKCDNDKEIASPLQQKPIKRSRGRPRDKTDLKQVSKLAPVICGQVEKSVTYASTASASRTQFRERAKRVRGRPRGKPPKLNLQERRERNAELERERRAELGRSYELLRIALGGNPESCDTHTDELSRENLLVEAVKALKRPSPEFQLADLRRQNSLLKMQIERLQSEG